MYARHPKIWFESIAELTTARFMKGHSTRNAEDTNSPMFRDVYR